MIKRIEFNVLGCGMNTRTTANELLIDVAHERLNNWLVEHSVSIVSIESIYETKIDTGDSRFICLRLWYTD
ncbi:conserved hypothetical protein [Vibrio crassostreae]|jgi:hypothetical protein|nr:hypothetical protein BCT34_06230 [Vibrio sp. 10N.261.45.E2]PMN47271.1 hypothetical protein BCT32_09780 [Vibrio sp. 10N.261.45.E11]CAK2044639.1 conserved hypothetical protein [Vibrio crassostreae]